jgi:hypothetical protein
MIHLRELEQKIQDRLAVAEQRRRHHEDLRHHHHAARQERAQQFRAVADRLVRHHIRPRLDRLSAPFPARPLHPADQGPNRCVYVFHAGPRFPVGGTLEVAVHHDLDVEWLFVLYRLDLLPVPFPFVSDDRLILPLAGADEAHAAAWIEERLLEALDVCLRVQAGERDEGEAEPPVLSLAA